MTLLVTDYLLSSSAENRPWTGAPTGPTEVLRDDPANGYSEAIGSEKGLGLVFLGRKIIKDEDHPILADGSPERILFQYPPYQGNG